MNHDGHHGHDDDYGRCLESLIEVFLYIDGQLDEKRNAEIEHHLERCSKCYGRVEFEKMLRGYVKAKACSDGPPASLSVRVSAILRDQI